GGGGGGGLLARHAAAPGHRGGHARRPARGDVRRAVQWHGPRGHHLDARLPRVPGRPGPGRAGVQPPDERAGGHRRSPGDRRPGEGDRRHQHRRVAGENVRWPRRAAPRQRAAGGGRAATRRGGRVARRPGDPDGLRPSRGAGRRGAVGKRCGVLRGRHPPGLAGGGLPGTHRRRGGLPGRHGRGGHAMTAGTVTPQHEAERTRQASFGLVLRAEWTKFRTVRGWVIGMIVAVLVTVLAGLLAASGTRTSCRGPGGQGCPPVPVGPGGEPVTDKFTFAHQSLTGNGSITARATALTGIITYPQSSSNAIVPGVEPWAKAGIIIKENTSQGSAYAAVMVTGRHGVRMQYNYTHDVAGPAGGVSAPSPRWLRLTRSG